MRPENKNKSKRVKKKKERGERERERESASRFIRGRDNCDNTLRGLRETEILVLSLSRPCEAYTGFGTGLSFEPFACTTVREILIARAASEGTRCLWRHHVSSSRVWLWESL